MQRNFSPAAAARVEGRCGQPYYPLAEALRVREGLVDSAGLALGCTYIMNNANPVVALLLTLLTATHSGPTRRAAWQAAGGPSPQLKIGGSVTTPLDLSADDLKRLPRQNLRVVDPHTQKTESYEGVAIHDLLHRAGVPEGENFRGAAMTTYLVAEGTDGYRVVFSLAELDPETSDSEVMVADTMDGAPLDAKHGPFQLVAPHDKRAARWVRMLKALTVGQTGKCEWFAERSADHVDGNVKLQSSPGPVRGVNLGP
jgi:hypothetical protein